jgi:hypothetical protein
MNGNLLGHGESWLNFESWRKRFHGLKSATTAVCARLVRIPIARTKRTVMDHGQRDKLRLSGGAGLDLPPLGRQVKRRVC